jgi:hypothetical protein
MVTGLRAETIDWADSRRIVSTVYPPVWLFEDIADPADWELVANVEAKTNPRVMDQLGAFRRVPVERRVAGSGASYAMAPFCHASTARPNRFSDGSFGVWYSGDVFEVALMETAHHFARFMASTNEPAGDRRHRELVMRVRGELLVVDSPDHLAPDSWAASQQLGREILAEGGNGVVYPSVRYPRGRACALFYPDLIAMPVIQARTLQYHWDGTEMTRYFVIGEADWREIPEVALKS